MNYEVRKKSKLSTKLYLVLIPLAFLFIITRVAFTQDVPSIEIDMTEVIEETLAVEAVPTIAPEIVKELPPEIAEYVKPVVEDKELNYVEVFKEFNKSFGEYKSVPKYGIPMIIVQLLILLLRSPLGKRSKGFKLVAVSGLSFISVILVSLIGGHSLAMIIQDGAVITALSVFGNQVYKKSVKKS